MKKKIVKHLPYLFLLISDIIAIYLSFILAYFFRSDFLHLILNNLPKPPVYYYYHRFYYLLFFYIGIFIYHNLYFIRRDFWSEFKEIGKCAFVWIILSFALLAVMKVSTEASRVILIGTAIFSLFVISFIRYILKWILYKIKVWQLNSAVFVSNLIDLKKIIPVIKNINGKWYSGYVVSTIIVYSNKRLPRMEFSEFEILHINKLKKENLYKLLKEKNIEELFVYNVKDSLFEKIMILNDEQIVEVRYIPSFQDIKTLNVKLHIIGDVLTITLKNNLASKWNILQKKIFDFVVSLFLTILLLPLFFLIALLIKVTSKGPILYKARRIGKNFRNIYIYKFRTMYQDADKRLKTLLDSDPDLKKEFEETFKLKNDPRVTKIGKFLRKYSLDELPQLFNVLKLELSLVGPRPIVREEVKKYGKYFEEVIKVRPGITGLWQVSGRNDIGYDNRVRLDIFYIRNWSLWLDIKILLKTLPAVIKGKGAY